jgi:hypothetical protein
VCLLCLALLLWTDVSVQAKQATIEDIILTTTSENLLLYCTIKNCFTEEMNRAILNGIPTTFTFHIQLHKKIRFFFDKKLADMKVNHTIKYDALRNEFALTLGSKSNSTITVKEFFKAKSLLTEVNGLKLASLDQIQSDRKYCVRIKAALNKVRLPFYLHYILFFVSLWDFETDWHEVLFTLQQNR